MNDTEIFETVRKLRNGEVTPACEAIRADEDPAVCALAVGLAWSVTLDKPVMGYAKLRTLLKATAK